MSFAQPDATLLPVSDLGDVVISVPYVNRQIHCNRNPHFVLTIPIQVLKASAAGGSVKLEDRLVVCAAQRSLAQPSDSMAPTTDSQSYLTSAAVCSRGNTLTWLYP